MDIIEKARELGKLIQQEESYIALQKAQADGFLHTRRCDGKAAGLCGGGVYQSDPSGL